MRTELFLNQPLQSVPELGLPATESCHRIASDRLAALEKRLLAIQVKFDKLIAKMTQFEQKVTESRYEAPPDMRVTQSELQQQKGQPDNLSIKVAGEFLAFLP